ncbi:MAG: aminopeptidase [Candidatus Beckwithbacteria bacterium]
MTELTSKILTACRNALNQCLVAKSGESVLIVNDPTRTDLVGSFKTAAKEITDKVEVITFPGTKGNGQEPTLVVAQKLLSANIAFLITRYSLSHTKARKNACEAGCRIASMPGITLEMIARTLSADYLKIAKLSNQLANILTKADTARLTSPSGTNLSFMLTNRLGFADTGIYTKPGSWGNLPAGEACIGPLENKTQGTLVIDGALADIDLDQPIKININNGFATNITGGNAAKKLKSQLNAVGPEAFQIAELGIGTNPLAILQSDILEAEKVYGTCHVALGNNLSYGGTINVPFHSDGLITQPTLTIDGKIILKAGKFNL